MTMEAKAAQFVTTFGRTIFDKWTQSEEKELFWKDTKFLHNLLEEAVAKLPKIPLKGEVKRELSSYTQHLKQLLQETYVEYVKKQQQEQESADSTANKTTATLLLNEEDVERALTLADEQERERISAILCLDEYADVLKPVKDDKATDLVDRIERLASLYRVIFLRKHEAPALQHRKLAFVLLKVTDCVNAVLCKWTNASKSNWNCLDLKRQEATDVDRMRSQLQMIIAIDVTCSFETQDGPSGFYQPEPSDVFTTVDYHAEIAKIYGSLLTLALFFPLFHDDDDDSSDDSERDSDDDEDSTSTKRPQEQAERGVAFARKTTQQLVFAAKRRRPDVAASWLVMALAQVHQTPKPSQYLDDDEEDSTLVEEDQASMHECLGDVYSKLFTLVDWKVYDGQDLVFFQTLVCLRHAVDFMRHQRRQSIPSVATALAKLVSVPLPASFWKWMADLKKHYATIEPEVLRDIVKQLWKNKSTKMANVLMSDSLLSRTALECMAEQYAKYLDDVRRAEEKKSIKLLNYQDATGSRTIQSQETPADDAEVVTTGADALFFVDNDGGQQTTTTTSTSKSKKNRKKRKASATTTSEVPAPAKQKTSA